MSDVSDAELDWVDDVLGRTIDPPWTLRAEVDGTVGVYLIRPHLTPPHNEIHIARFNDVDTASFVALARILVPALVNQRARDEAHPIRFLIRALRRRFRR